MQKLAPSITIVGLIVVVAGAIVGWIVVPNFIDGQIKEQVRLVPGEETWDTWVDIPVPVYMKFYIFHVENPDEVERGEKPRLTQKGPYSYREDRVKFNVELKGENVVTFEQNITYHFEKESSCESCSDSDRVNVINVAFMSVVAGVKDLAGDFLAMHIANGALGSEKMIWRNVRVDELLFKGIDVRHYSRTIGPLLPAEFDGGIFGLYRLNNGTSGGVYEIYTGVDNVDKFGLVKTYEGNTTLVGWWIDGSPCAMINGTDGTIFPPFVEKDRTIYIFVTELCRSVYFKYEKDVEYDGIKGYRFIVPETMLEDPRVNWDNMCFCNEEDLNNCPHKGTLPIKKCMGGAPLVVTLPLFYQGYHGYSDLVEIDGEPNKELHETVIDVEPNTGVNLFASKKIQMNIEVKPVPGVRATQNITHDYMLFPLVWVDESGGLDDESKDDLKSQLLTPLKIVQYAKWSAVGLGAVLTLGGFGFFAFRYYRS